MLDISSKRWHIKQEHGVTTARDMTAPYHCHTIDASKLPTAHALAMMTEAQFDKLLSELVYG